MNPLLTTTLSTIKKPYYIQCNLLDKDIVNTSVRKTFILITYPPLVKNFEKNDLDVQYFQEFPYKNHEFPDHYRLIGKFILRNWGYFHWFSFSF